MKIDTVLVLGLGKIGVLVATLLQKTGFRVTGADLRKPEKVVFPFTLLNVSDLKELEDCLKRYDAVVSCLPYTYNVGVATLAHSNGLHYFDLTEDVKTTRAIMKMGRSANCIMAPQCGLAPGFIAIVGASLARKFDRVRSIRLRVGALPRHPTGLMGYAFNWSPEGVVNEYLNDCEVIEDGVHKWVSPLEWLETIVIDGVQLEAFTTSGGLGTMCRTFEGLVENLDYKSIRYPGHAELMNFFLHELLLREDRKRAGEILVNAKPPVSDDVVYIHASAEGMKQQKLFREEYVRAYSPINVSGLEWRAIAWTTAASVCAVIEMTAEGKLEDKGFIKMEEIDLAAFLATHNGRLYNGEPHGGPLKRS